MPIALRVRELREARGWSQRELAARAGLRQATIANIELGHTRGVRFDALERLADALGVDPALLIVRTPPLEQGRGRGR